MVKERVILGLRPRGQFAKPSGFGAGGWDRGLQQGEPPQCPDGPGIGHTVAAVGRRVDEITHLQQTLEDVMDPDNPALRPLGPQQDYSRSTPSAQMLSRRDKDH